MIRRAAAAVLLSLAAAALVLPIAPRRRIVQLPRGVTYLQSEMIVGIFVAVLLSWSVEENFPVVDKTKQVVNFINQSMLK